MSKVTISLILKRDLHIYSNILFHFRRNYLPTFRGFTLIRNLSEKHQMPKKDKTCKGSQNKKSETCVSPSGPVACNKRGDVTISVHAKPGSKQNAITDVSAEAVGVAIAAPPTDGEANSELVRYLSKVLDVKKSEVTLDKGSRSREKVIKLSGSLTPEEVLERLKKEATG
ncbi:UPF0235 protein C15orf40 homolog [Osmerus eperlanus]|uniref:UPF0235 protein C15orf40 homolog n=1 Tax=Osmerus eperlanus TaxID=29151 RepID=UPI002E103970